MTSNIETPELTFMTKIHELTVNADKLIEVYAETHATIESLPAEMDFPNKQESLDLTRLTIDTILGLKVAVTSLTEHSAQMNDAIENAVRDLNNRK